MDEDEAGTPAVIETVIDGPEAGEATAREVAAALRRLQFHAITLTGRPEVVSQRALEGERVLYLMNGTTWLRLQGTPEDLRMVLEAAFRTLAGT